jgi:ABC-type spermidine/putrescine transport system permease subunit II
VETTVVAFAIMTAATAVIIAVAAFVAVTRRQRRTWPALRPWSTAGFPWLILGIAGTIVFALVDQSVLLPLLIALGGLIAVFVGVYRQWRKGL